MKDSGIEWIGNIPQEWEIIKNKYVFKRRNNKVAENYINYQLLSLTKKGIVEKNLNETGGKLPASFSTYQEVQKDDIVLCLFDLDVSAVFSGISKYHGMISSAYDIFKTNQESIPNYYDYLFQIIGFDRLYLPFSKSLRKTINKENFNSIYTIKPPYNEQIKIVDFLNKSTMNINNIITQTYQSIEELKKYKQSLIAESVTKGIDPNVEMKDSGIEWIGMIPKHWTIKKVKYFLSESSVKNYPNETVLSLYRDYGVIPKDSRTDNHNVTSSDTSSYKLIEKNDVVINKMKAWQGSLGVSSFKGIISPAYYVYKIIDSDIYSNFLHYVLRNNLYLDEYRRISSGIRIGQWDLEKKEFEKLLYPFPNSTSEQQQIVQYLDKKIFTIDSLIEDKTKVIEELENYKKSLIYEYVTGKKEV
ncbi:restriction endonuclease subunit S [Staphylococcus epidermidis]|nr:restriction endonuclease subunit S [Staphylococcus epidermidis]